MLLGLPMSPRADARPQLSAGPTPAAQGAHGGRLATWRAAVSRPASPVALLAATATAVAIVDLATKQIAGSVLGMWDDIPLPLLHAIRLKFILNDQSAFGVSLGPYTWHINLVLTTVALLLCLSLCRALAAIDRWAPVMLGLITGAATGNLVSLIASPEGVPDFIAVRSVSGHELVFNLADLAAVIGIALLIRTTWAVGHALRLPQRASIENAVKAARLHTAIDREVDLNSHRPFLARVRSAQAPLADLPPSPNERLAPASNARRNPPIADRSDQRESRRPD